ncbi:nitrate reductase associated protein [Ferruginibacter sp. SUN106]|uniref:nitrate reductase associated protein n=1 Tax=Ferruginibacter sp. SUN106 TaxID=2978348 RepID=UPI003D35ED08
MEQQTIKRTTSNDSNFQWLIKQLDHELWNELQEDQAQYDQYNKVPDLNTVVVVYINDQPAASGCFKKYNTDTVEVKRMFVVKEHRGKGLSKLVLNELENWAMEEGFKYAILETSIHFIPATTLYKKSGYKIIPNYDQYEGLEESVCMKKELTSSEFRELAGIEYFNFEEDFVEENVRCIPMIVRFKMDAAGIKLKLAEWSKFKRDERIYLALMPAATDEEAKLYNDYLSQLIEKYTSNKATELTINTNPDWANLHTIPEMLAEKAKEFDLEITPEKWSSLTNLQRFTLLKLCRPGHENKNFPKAIIEFGLVQ